jgi:hypothetical protein
VSILLTKFCNLDAGWVLVVSTCVEEEGVHGGYSFGGVGGGMLAASGDQVWLVLWPRFSFDYTRGAKGMV